MIRAIDENYAIARPSQFQLSKRHISAKAAAKNHIYTSSLFRHFGVHKCENKLSGTT